MNGFPQAEDEITIVAASEVTVTEHLLQLVSTLSTLPTFLKAPVRNLKVMSARRGYPVRNEYHQQVYMETSRIYLVGDWISRTGLNCHERIKVIPMHRLLIIIPEENEMRDE